VHSGSLFVFGFFFIYLRLVEQLFSGIKRLHAASFSRTWNDIPLNSRDAPSRFKYQVVVGPNTAPAGSLYLWIGIGAAVFALV
jgi:hypothetical protein